MTEAQSLISQLQALPQHRRTIDGVAWVRLSDVLALLAAQPEPDKWKALEDSETEDSPQPYCVPVQDWEQKALAATKELERLRASLAAQPEPTTEYHSGLNSSDETGEGIRRTAAHFLAPTPSAWQPKCQDCRFWERQNGKGEDVRFGTCSCEQFYRGYGEPKELAPATVLVEDDEGWAFVTGPEFGCVHFQAAPPADADKEP